MMKKAYILSLLLTFSFSVSSNSENKITISGDGNNIEAVNIGDKITNIKNVNGDINFSKNNIAADQNLLKINNIKLTGISGFSEVFYNSETGIFYIKEHAHKKPKIRRLEVTKNNYNYFNISNVKGDIVNQKNVFHMKDVTYSPTYIDASVESSSSKLHISIGKR